jgi:hypothetical protein
MIYVSQVIEAVNKREQRLVCTTSGWQTLTRLPENPQIFFRAEGNTELKMHGGSLSVELVLSGFFSAQIPPRTRR